MEIKNLTNCRWRGPAEIVRSYLPVSLCNIELNNVLNCRLREPAAMVRSHLPAILCNILQCSQLQVAGACGNGQVIFAHVIEKRLEWRDYEATITGRKTIVLRQLRCCGISQNSNRRNTERKFSAMSFFQRNIGHLLCSGLEDFCFRRL